jgi:solute:Na+ symporter, SSS family
MPDLRWLDLTIMLAYMAAMVSVGLRFSRKQTSTEMYFVAKRSIPSWAMGISLVATLITSVTFVAYPGASYAKDWSLLVPGFMAVATLALCGATVVPFYRQVVGMSAYEYFGKRFGRPTRIYSSLAFSLTHFSKMGMIFYLLALTVNSMTGWSMDSMILGVGVVTIFYTLIGGLEAVIWTDVIQGCVLWLGVFVALGYLLFLPPGGPSAVFHIAWANHKFNLGSPHWDLSRQTFPVLAIYGFFFYLQKYTGDQTMIQRYLVARSDRAAIRGISIGAILCVPVWTLFMLIGTCTWAFFQLSHLSLPSYITKADQVFPYFLTSHLPHGMAGLFMATLMGAAMSGLASDLNALAVVGVEDFYRAIRPASTDRQRLFTGKVIVACAGVLCIVVAEVLAHSKGGALSTWFSLSAIFAGGLAGLFILAFFSSRTSRKGIYIGIAATVLFTAWATLTAGNKPLWNLGPVKFPWNDLMIGAIGHIVFLVFGYLGSLMFPREQNAASEMTFWTWLRDRKRQSIQAATI